jgi:hypothetical protein
MLSLRQLKTIKFSKVKNAQPHRKIVRAPTIKKRIDVKVHSSEMSNALIECSYYIGKSVILFTMFYCTLNWYYYKRLREQQEEENKDD